MANKTIHLRFTATGKDFYRSTVQLLVTEALTRREQVLRGEVVLNPLEMLALILLEDSAEYYDVPLSELANAGQCERGDDDA